MLTRPAVARVLPVGRAGWRHALIGPSGVALDRNPSVLALFGFFDPLQTLDRAGVLP
jgi:hypothetical protein